MVVLFIVGVIAAIGWFIYKTSDIWAYFCISVFVAYLMSGPVNLLSNRINRSLAILIMFGAITCCIVVIILLFVPELQKEIGEFIKTVPAQIEEMQGSFTRLNKLIDEANLPDQVKVALTQVPDKLLGEVGSASGQFAKLFPNILKLLQNMFMPLIIVPITTFFLLKDTHLFHDTFIRCFPEESRGTITGLLAKVDTAFGGFIRSRLKLCLVVGVGMMIGLRIVGMKFSLLLGLICGICEFVPYIGPLVGAVPVVLVGVLTKKTIIALVIVLIVQFLENVIFVPTIMGGEMGLHPLLVLFALMAGGRVWGLGGMLLSVPLVATAKIFLEYYMANSSNGEINLPAAEVLTAEDGQKPDQEQSPNKAPP